MAKAMLIMDKPSSCNECDLKEFYCHVDDNDICRAGGCPLREVPQKKRNSKNRNCYIVKGYNLCIDEILGGNVR